MIKGGFLSESLLKKMFQITIQIREFEFAGQTVDNFFKFSAQDSDLKYFFEPLQTLWQKATFSCVWFCFISTYIDHLRCILDVCYLRIAQ